MSNFIGRTLHQVRKDILRARWMLLFFAATLAGIVLFATHPAPLQVAGCIDECSTPRDSAVFAIGALSVAAFLLLVVSLVQEDSPTRTDAHWVSEPVAGLSVLASKVFLLVSVELVAIALSQIITVVVLDFSPRLLFPFFANASYTLTTLTLFTVAVAAATPSLKLSIFALFAYGALWFGVEYLYWDSAIQRHYANAHILGLRGDLWMAAICALLVWAYWSRATSVRRRRWTVLLGLTPLVFAWQSPDNAPLRVFSSAAAPSSRLLPEPRVTVKREGYNFRVDIFVAAPAKDTRYRFVNGLVVLQFDEGSSVLLDGAESNTVVDSQLVHDVSARPLADRTETNHWTFLAPYDAAAGRMLERSAAKIVVDGFLVEQKRSLVGELSLVPGGKLARENLRVGVVRPAYDSMPQRV
ncbi:MAG: hypothetical protein ABJB74_11450, partial [Gemmatimonas sp.]